MMNDRIGMRIQMKKKIKILMYLEARSRATFEELGVVGLGVVTTRDKAEVELDVMVGRGSKEMESYFSSGTEEKWDGGMLGVGRVEEGAEL